MVAENAVTGAKIRQKVDMCVLATGMQPALGEQGKAFGLDMDGNGFIVSNPDKGMIAAGCAKSAADVYSSAQSATAAALKAIQIGR